MLPPADRFKATISGQGENVFAENTLTARILRRLVALHARQRIFFLWPFAGLALLLFVAIILDAPVTEALISWPPYERAFFEFLTDFGKSDWILIPAFFGMIIGLAAARFMPLAYSWKWAARALGGVSAFVFVGVGLPGLVSAILKRAIGRARPFHLEEHGVLHFEPFSVVDWTMQSFPSGHSTTALAFTVVLITLLNGRLRKTLIIIGMAIGLSRIVGEHHFLTDVLAGMAWGTIGAILVRDWFVTRNFGMRVESGRVRYRLFAGFKPILQRIRRRQMPALFR